MTESKLPRIQFRLSKLNDGDLIKVFQPVYDDPDGDVTAEVKRLIRLGIEYEELLEGKGAIVISKPKSARLSEAQKNFIQVTKEMRKVLQQA